MAAGDRPSNDSEAPAMTTTTRRCTASLLGLLLVFGASSSARAAAAPAAGPDTSAPIRRMPPRLSYVDGEVSLWRPGAADWAPAPIHPAPGPGHETYTGTRGHLEP